MRYYLINKSNDEEFVIDLIDHRRINKELMEFHYRLDFENGHTIEEKVYIRKLAGRYFTSFDRRRWFKTPKQELPENIVNLSKDYKLYRGFKPSGIFHGDKSSLVTQMPGKVIDIKVKERDKVVEGQTLLVIEAMKMENEIKAGMDGEIKAIHVKVGQILESGVQLVEIN